MCYSICSVYIERLIMYSINILAVRTFIIRKRFKKTLHRRECAAIQLQAGLSNKGVYYTFLSF